MAHGVRDVLVSEVLLDDLEGRVSLAATADSLGHQGGAKGTKLSGSCWGPLMFEAGALANMSVEMASIFSRD